jgi:N-methylhydantoinase A/oxoprolinase/acetone carboxylase beta subunit
MEHLIGVDIGGTFTDLGWSGDDLFQDVEIHNRATA